MAPLFLKIAALLVRRVAVPTFGTPHPHPDEVIQIPSRDEGRTIKGHVYKNKSEKPADGPVPLLLNLCGSGFMLPLHGSDEVFCRVITEKTPYLVVDIEYRLAPEHPFPAALNDVEDCVKWALSQPEKYDASKLCLSGFSAGGNLALAVSSSVLPKDAIKGVVATYPVTDLFTPPSEREQVEQGGKQIPSFVAKLFDASYLQGLTDRSGRRDPRISPSFADAERFPRNVTIISAGYDNLAGQAEELARKISTEGDTGRFVVCKRVSKVNHAWDKKVREGSYEEKGRDDAYNLAAEMLVRCAE